MNTPRRVVLLIDDNLTNLKIAIEHLQAYHFEILTARNGESGLLRAQEAQPDLILLDVQMPGLDGFETCRRLKAHPRTGEIPVIFMTALADVEDKVRGFEAGAVDYIAKPLDATELVARVNTHLRLRALQTELQHSNEQLTALVRQLEQRNYEAHLLNTLGEVLQTCQTSEEAYVALTHYMTRLLPHAAGALYLLASSRNVVESAVRWGERAVRDALEAFFAPEACWALRRGQLHIVNTMQADLPCQHVLTTTSAYLCVPLSVGGETLGILHLQSTTENMHTLSAQQQFVTTIAAHVALSLANLKLRETLRQQSIRDPLTGLFNRRYMEETLEREVYRATRTNTPLSIIMLDIDHFKRFNDSHSHEAGDAVLKTLGEFLRTHIRSGDVPCRYGGEEFALILPGAALEVALQRAEMLRTEATKLQASLLGQSLGAITLSLGVAVLPQHGATGDSVLRAADLALYQAKQAGRNRVVAA